MPRVFNKHHKDAPKDAVFVGRPSKWGNPYTIGEHQSRETCIDYYRQYIAGKHDLIKRELRGKDLVCFCHPKPCHADVLLEIANGDE